MLHACTRAKHTDRIQIRNDNIFPHAEELTIAAEAEAAEATRKGTGREQREKKEEEEV